MRDYLKIARAKLGLSQNDVAKSIEISRQYYQQIESGIRQSSMDITLASKISHVLKIPMDQIVKNEEQINTSVSELIEEKTAR